MRNVFISFFVFCIIGYKVFVQQYSMTSMEEIKKDIDLINSFSTDFYTKNNQIIGKINSVMSKLDTIISEEKQNETYLRNLQQKVTDSELNNILKTFLTYKQDIENKNTEYNKLIENNKQFINDISKSLRDNDTIIKTVYDTVKSIEDTTTNIEAKLNK